MTETRSARDAMDEAHHAHALKARAERRAKAEAMGVDADYVSRFVDGFYGKIRQDAVLGPIFAEKVGDWDEHLGRMKRFWRSILFSSGEYSGNPMPKHVALPGLDESHFARWLDLFYATLREQGGSEEAARMVGTRARMIADSLLTGIAIHRDGMVGSRAGENLPRP
ncbi:MAG: group III truncated hemoglobin [Novosphingobium sp.]|nr:group III truncated hemoglobin [Novosphingobium sp.]